jgi:hypothetical protein
MRYAKPVALAGVLMAAVVLAAPVLGQEATKPVVVSHDLAGRDNCMMCHSGAMEAVPGVPETHADRTNETCLWCHGADADVQKATPKIVSHDLAGRDNCMMCHKAGAMEPVPDAPASHEGRDIKWCTMCHVANSG